MEQIELALECASLGTVRTHRLCVREALSSPTSAWVDVVCDDALDAASAIGKEAVIRVSADGQEVRRWTLVVSSLSYEASTEDGHHYIVGLEHELALLSLRSDVRMFQNKTTQEIVSSVLQAAGIPAERVKWQLERALSPRVYCVQHRESDTNFMARLLEYEGIFYVPTETDSPRVLFADSQQVFESFDGADGEISVVDGHGLGVREFSLVHAMTPDAVVIRDYNFETPTLDLEAKSAFGSPVQGTLFEFPGGHGKPDDGKALIKIRAEEVLAQRVQGMGRADSLQFRPGTWFQLEGAAREELCKSYLLREVTHFVRADGDAMGARDYENSFVCSPLDQPYRPGRSAARPRIHGSESVVVTGPSGSEIYTDQYARMKGKFYWDRVGKDDENASCWMRVLQHPIGGSMALARMKWEMDVRFLHGDPDRPVAMYRVDNAQHTAPYAYPAAASAMSFKTLSSPGGGKFNEIAMEDGGGGMKFGFNASKDYAEVVNNNKTEKIAVDESMDVGIDHVAKVGASQTVSIGAMLSQKVGSDSQVAIAGDRTKTVGAAEMVTVSGSDAATINGSDTESVGATCMTVAGLGISRTAKGSQSLTVGGVMVSAAGLGYGVMTLGSRSETVGAVKVAAAGAAINESMVGAMALTVGGVCVNVASGNHTATSKANSTLTVGGVALANAGGQLQITAKTINITVAGMANLLGGGGILNLTPGSGAFVGMVTLKGSDGVKIQGSPNLAG